MSELKRTKGISKETARSLHEGESERVDFKRTPDSISTEDLVAFANSEQGGAILCGVDERSGPGGAQIGVVRGCDVNDATVLQIANKALSCLPPIAIEISIENLAKVPFLRVDISASVTKPHCSPKGIYCRRDGNRNRALHPSELLKIFLDSETRAFSERFESAADRITENITELEKSLGRSIKNMADELGWADSKLGDTESTLGTILAFTARIDGEATDLTTRMRSLFRQDKRQDPIYDRERKNLLDKLVEQILTDKNIQKGIAAGGSMSITAKGKTAEELTKDDLGAVFHEAVKIATDRLEQKKYTIEIKKPSDYKKSQLADLVQLITEGGEVAGGLEARIKTADVLGVIRYEKNAIGVAAIKKPDRDYRATVFEKAKSTASPAVFPFELGWIFLKEAHRRKGQIQLLIPSLLKSAETNGVYATTRVSNQKMQKILKHYGFVREGEAYRSRQHPEDEIVLFLRPATGTPSP